MNFKEIDYTALGKSFLPELLGIEVTAVGENFGTARIEIKKSHLAPNGYLHAGTIVTLADTIAGYGCLYNLPENANSFTTIELKSNFSGTAREGIIIAEAKMEHGGKTTQIWDVVIKHEQAAKTIALFRCTQFILYNK
jgi:1,4-dihydroxy-2-naphthoyl-CoA hydrolase